MFLLKVGFDLSKSFSQEVRFDLQAMRPVNVIKCSAYAAGDLDVVRRLLAATANPNGASEVLKQRLMLRLFGIRMKQRQKRNGEYPSPETACHWFQ